MLIEFHMLKNYPPVNLNRDDSGAPKNCFFGGVQRGRISSQCLKRSWRTSDTFKNLGSFGIRTRKMPEQVAEKLIKMGVDKEMAAEAMVKLTGIANKEEKTTNDGQTSQIVFYSSDEIEELALRVKEKIESTGNLKEFKKLKLKDFENLKDQVKNKPVTADVALFGRMVTSEYLRNVDASMQVAHAISTHAVNRESDYFTAMDDLLKAGEETGAGMIGDVDYNSCCYYEYASLDTDALLENLKGVEGKEELAKKLIPVLLRAMAFSNPSGKQNTFAGQVLPSMILVECKRDKIPLSYANAYETPVSTWGSNPQIVKNSIEKLITHVNDMDETYELPVLHRAVLMPSYKEEDGVKLGQGERIDKFSALAEKCASWLNEEKA